MHYGYGTLAIAAFVSIAETPADGGLGSIASQVPALAVLAWIVWRQGKRDEAVVKAWAERERERDEIFKSFHADAQANSRELREVIDRNTQANAANTAAMDRVADEFNRIRE